MGDPVAAEGEKGVRDPRENIHFPLSFFVQVLSFPFPPSLSFRFFLSLSPPFFLSLGDYMLGVLRIGEGAL